MCCYKSHSSVSLDQTRGGNTEGGVRSAGAVCANYVPLEGKAKQIYLCRTFQNTKAILKCFTSGHIFSCCHWESYMQMGFSDKTNYVHVRVSLGWEDSCGATLCQKRFIFFLRLFPCLCRNWRKKGVTGNWKESKDPACVTQEPLICLECRFRR